MSPFHNRPPLAVEPLTLGSGDIEAVEYAPRAPGFPPPPGRAAHPMQPPARQRQTTGHRVPSPSPSLAPVAMNAVRGRADSSGPQHASVETLVIRSRPTMKMGFSILMAGIIFGGVLGITTRTKPASAAYQPSVETVLDAKDAKEGKDSPKDEALPPSAKAAEPASDAKAEAKNDASSDEPKDTAKPGAKKKRGGGAVRGSVVSAPKAAKEKPEKAEKPSKDDDDGYRVASADPNAEREPAKPTKASKKPAKAQDDEDDAPAPPVAKRGKPKASDDAASVLKAAMGATENTL